MTAFDTLLAALRTTLADPPAIVLEAERELQALRAELRSTRPALEDAFGGRLVMYRAQKIASGYEYGVAGHGNELVGQCREFPSLSWTDTTAASRSLWYSQARDRLRCGHVGQRGDAAVGEGDDVIIWVYSEEYESTMPNSALEDIRRLRDENAKLRTRLGFFESEAAPHINVAADLEFPKPPLYGDQ